MKKYLVIFYLLLFIAFTVNAQDEAQYTQTSEPLNFDEKIYQILVDRDQNKLIWAFVAKNKYGIYLQDKKKIIFDKPEAVYDFKYGLIATADISDVLLDKTTVKIYRVQDSELSQLRAIEIKGRYIIPKILNENRILIQKYGEGVIDFTYDIYDFAGNQIALKGELPQFNYSATSSNRNHFFLHSLTDPSYFFDKEQDIYIYKINSKSGSNVAQIKISNNIVSDVVAGDNLVFVMSDKRIIAYDTTLRKVWENDNISRPNRIIPCRGTNLVTVTTRDGVYFLNIDNGSIEHSIAYQKIQSDNIKVTSADSIRYSIKDMNYNTQTKTIHIALVTTNANQSKSNLITIHLPNYSYSKFDIEDFNKEDRVRILNLNNNDIKVFTYRTINTIKVDK